jgi:hypothetical protein
MLICADVSAWRFRKYYIIIAARINKPDDSGL